jgi:gliding motility-associated-like protein
MVRQNLIFRINQKVKSKDMKRLLAAALTTLPALLVGQSLTVHSGTTAVLHSGTAVTCTNVSLEMEGALLAKPTTVIVMASSSGSTNNAKTISGNGKDTINTLKIAGNVRTERELLVSGNLIFSSGILDIQDYDLYLAGTIVGETSSSYLTASTGEVVSNQMVGSQQRSLLGLTATSQDNAMVEVRRGHATNQRGKDVSVSRYYAFSPPVNLGAFTFNYLPNEKNKVVEPQVSSYVSGEWVTNPLRGTKALEVEGMELTEKITVFNEPEVFIPKSFSPNGDGMNDLFELQGTEKHTNNHLIVFSQSSAATTVVLDKSPYINDWEGTFNGNELPEQTYFYIYYEDTERDKTPKKGFFELVR